MPAPAGPSFVHPVTDVATIGVAQTVLKTLAGVAMG